MHSIPAAQLACLVVEPYAAAAQLQGSKFVVEVSRGKVGFVGWGWGGVGGSQVDAFTAEQYSPHQIQRLTSKVQAPAPKGTYTACCFAATWSTCGAFDCCATPERAAEG
jgi:hypothetical protein